MEILDSVENFGNEYMMAYHKGANLFDYAKLCETVTVEEAEERLDTLLREEQCSTSIVFPKGRDVNE